MPVRPLGLAASLAGLWHRTYRDVPPVQEVSFAIAPGAVDGAAAPAVIKQVAMMIDLAQCG